MLARADSEGFIPNLEIYSRDTEELCLAGSLPELVKRRQSAALSNRLNCDRVRDAFGACAGSEDYDRALSIAGNGITIPVVEDFNPQLEPAPLRPLSMRLGNTYLKHAAKLWTGGDVLIIQLDNLPSCLRGALNFGNNAHWTVKPDDVMGRFLSDPNHPLEGFSGLNEPATFAVMEELYGKLNLV